MRNDALRKDGSRSRRRGRDRAAGLAAPMLVVTIAVGVLAALAVARSLHVHARAKAAAPAAVAAFPSPGSRFIAPGSQISFRGVSRARLGAVTVTGSRTGNHKGRIVADSDGVGASFLPSRPFAAGEQVTVRTHLNILGGHGGTFHLAVAQPAGAISYAPLPPAKRVSHDVQAFRSRPDLQPVTIKMLKSDSSGPDLFASPQQGPLQNGVMIMDGGGKLVWWKAMPPHDTATDFRVQTYRGQPVLTWWQGYLGAGIGVGTGQIYDSSYHRIAEVKAGNGLSADLHEFELTPRNTALVTAYQPVWLDRSDGASRREIVLDSVVQEIDIPTGLVLFEWHSLDHVELGDSRTAVPKSPGSPFDYFHVNAVRDDADGNLLISARNTWAAYKVDARSGAIRWTLGGRHSSFRLTSSAVFAFQHDVRTLGAGDKFVTLFDDGGGPPTVHRQSRLLELSLDFRHHTAREVSERSHSPALLANFEGNYQQLPGGSVFAGWGQQPYFTEYDAAGHVVLDGRFADQNAHYRAYRFAWNGTPRALPAIAYTGGKSPAVFVSWNGATAVAGWRLIGGPNAGSMVALATATPSGFETRISVAAPPPDLAVQALDSAGNVLATSRAVSTR